MTNPMKVVLKITSVKGTCAAGHKVGEEFDLSKDFVLGYSGNGKALCPSAFLCLFPELAGSPFRRRTALGRR
jgi:uncharacterized repeat protein (TIGR04076 family)